MPGQQLKKWGYPHVTELHYPVGGIKTTRDRHNWIKGVYLDGRLTERAQHILTRLILYLNLNTQVCNPTLRNLAMMCGMGEDESAVRMVRGALEAGEKLGWIRRHMRFGGSSKYNQSSRIEFLVPDDVTPAGLAGSVKLKVVEQGGKWYVAQVKDGVKICGRFATREAAETWMMEHGPDWGTDRTLSKPDRIISRPDRTLLRSDRTPESALNTECMNTEYVKTKYGENSVLTYCGSNEPHSHPGCISINGCISDTSKPTPGKRIGTSRG